MAVDDEAGAGLLPDVIGEIIADDAAGGDIAPGVDDEDVAGLEQIDRRLVIQRAGVALLFQAAAEGSATSTRSGMSWSVKARPMSFLPGVSTWKPLTK